MRSPRFSIAEILAIIAFAALDCMAIRVRSHAAILIGGLPMQIALLIVLQPQVFHAPVFGPPGLGMRLPGDLFTAHVVIHQRRGPEQPQCRSPRVLTLHQRVPPPIKRQRQRGLLIRRRLIQTASDRADAPWAPTLVSASSSGRRPRRGRPRSSRAASAAGRGPRRAAHRRPIRSRSCRP